MTLTTLIRMTKSKIALYSIIGFIAASYVYYMFGYVTYSCDLSRDCIFNVWKEWQGLNASIIAFASAYILFTTQTKIEAKRRKNKAKAARVFLPHQLRNLGQICDDNLNKIAPALKASNTAENNNTFLPKDLSFEISYFGEKHFDYFKESIELEEGALSSELAELLQWMQIIEARLEGLTAGLVDLTGVRHLDFTARKYFLDIVCLKVRFERIYSYARGLSDEYHQQEIAYSDVVNATYGIDHMPVENYLSEYSKLYIEEKKYLLNSKNS